MAKTVHLWLKEAASLMIRERLSFRGALVNLQVAISGDEADKIERSAAFRKQLDMEQAQFYQELAANPNFNKQMVVGAMIQSAQQLIKEGLFEKAAEVWFKLARIQDWVGAESNVNIMMGVSQRDIDTQRALLLKEKDRVVIQ